MLSRPPIIILDSPQMGKNIGAVARSMHNFGIKDLRLINPREGWPNQEAQKIAVHSKHILDQAIVFETLEAALFDIHFVVATESENREVIKKVTTPKTLMHELSQRNDIGSWALVFGCEKSGLSNDHLSLAHEVVTIPTSKDFASLNLAHAVTVLCYEWLSSQKNNASFLNTHKTTIAQHEDVVSFTKRLSDSLDEKGYWREATKKNVMLRNMQNTFMRTQITNQELQTLHGILSALLRNTNS